ncbi:hypothetical protein PHLGIDRAFT_115315 [Phlebiopsis gigantea 11061_1 CR5-6]|uniref:Uncharacterized protein n=1 Tax=Phlebiopsis gigantea (strain 11061_1 CR5-6) TaxID=745531 RepID=A0A0C3SC30_PHLG1|nr:hypothetical protein PHLGIDRAFT_115315 [Phlebiopsis gigantea 11061_1 CR5-6]
MNRSVQTIDEAEASIHALAANTGAHRKYDPQYLLDQVPPPSADEDPIATKLRRRLQDLLTELRSGAEGVKKDV